MRLEGIQDTISKTDLAQKLQHIIQEQQVRLQQLAAEEENAQRTRIAEEDIDDPQSKEDAIVREDEGRQVPYAAVRRKRKKGGEEEEEPAEEIAEEDKGHNIDITV